MKIDVVSIEVKPGSLFSPGIGRGPQGELVNFIGKTQDMVEAEKKLKLNEIAMELQPWQYKHL